jgi:eukaryotic-like serine/threonine-protein kinase
VSATGERPRVLASRYELHHRLGRGGAGTVWRGHDRSLDRPVAVKLLHEELAHDDAAAVRFRTEATAAAKLTHPNAVLVYDLGEEDDQTYLVMELVEGVDLGDLLDEGPLPAGVVASIGAQVGGALGTAHAAGFVHRDVKPANVLVTMDGITKLADFGIARALGAATSRLTRTGTVLGTARYLAPEQLRDDPIDARADVYALGLVLYECLTGTPPFGEGSAVEVAARRLTTSLPPVSDVVPGVSPNLVEVIDWATRLDPRERPVDGGELADALRRFAAADAATTIAARVARVPQRTTTPAPSDRIRPVTPPPASSSPSATGTGPTGGDDRDTGPTGVDDQDTGPTAARVDDRAAARGDDHAATRAIPVTGEVDRRAGAVGAGGAGATAASSSGARDATSTLDAADGTAGGAVAGGARSSGTPHGKRWVLGAVAAIAVLLVAIGLNVGEDDPADPAGGAAEEDAAPTEDTDDDGEGQALPIAASGDLDPEGDLRERPDDVGNAYDGDPDTYWPTETYRSADFGGFPKSGVGIWLELEEPAALDRVEVEHSAAGGSLELWVSDGGPPDDEQLPDDWGTRLGGGEVPAERMQFPNLPDSEVRTVLLWFTDLPEGGGGWRGEIREARLIGR